MKYLKIFENFNRFERDDTDKGLNSNWRNRFHTTVVKDNYDRIKKYCKIDSEDINNILTDLLDEYSNLHFECAFYYNIGNLFTIYLYDPITDDPDGNYRTRAMYPHDYPRIKELSEDVNDRLEEYGLESTYEFSNKGNGGVSNGQIPLPPPTYYICYKFYVGWLTKKPKEEDVKKKKWWNRLKSW